MRYFFQTLNIQRTTFNPKLTTYNLQLLLNIPVSFQDPPDEFMSHHILSAQVDNINPFNVRQYPKGSFQTRLLSSWKVDLGDITSDNKFC